VLTLQQCIDYLHAHGAPGQLVQQIQALGQRHGLNSQSFQDALIRFHWRPQGVSWNDAANWVRLGHR
jgi:hypothetical protein